MLVRLLALLATLVAVALVPVPALAQPIVYVVRHLHTPEGVRDPDLLPEGRHAAETLANLFPANERPTAIYVTDFARSRQTAAPTMARFSLTPIVYAPGDTPALVEMVRAQDGVVLIVGHSNTVPDIVAALGGTRPAPLSHPDFGDVWRIALDGTTTHQQLAH